VFWFGSGKNYASKGAQAHMMIGSLSLLLTIGIYWGAKWCYQHAKKIYLTPLLVAPILIVITLLLCNISYNKYEDGGKWLTDLLQPATIAFAIPLYKFYPVLKKHLTEILLSVFIGSTISVLASALIAGSLHLNKSLIHSIIPYSITTPIAMGVSSKIGGIPTITAIFVIITGVTGMILGPIIIRIFKFRSDVAFGVLLGTSSHGAGTSKALELSSSAGAISSVCMILAALISFFVSPLITTYILQI
jgi:predicted murein hydrolase (TIGR00659 family)